MESLPRGNYSNYKKKNVQHFNSSNFNNVTSLILEAIKEEVFPSAVLLVAKNGEVLFQDAFGSYFIDQDTPDNLKVNLNTVYDLGNLSSVYATTTILMKLVAEGRISLKDQVIRYLQSFSVLGKAHITIGDLIFHISGLDQWRPFYEELLKENSATHLGILTSRGSKEYIINQINRSGLKYKTHTKQMYSDLGLILLGHIIETITGMTLDKVANKYVFNPLGLKNSSYIDLTLMKRRGILPVRELIAPTEDCEWRKHQLWGEVQDDNAWAMGGIAGHSGVFSNIFDLHSWALEMIKVYKQQSSYLPYNILKEFWNLEEGSDELSFAGGWEKPSKENGLLNTNLTSDAIGFNSNSGCLIWLEPSKGIEIILLSNRMCPTRNNKKIFQFRPELINKILTVV